MPKELVLKELKSEDFDYVFVFKHNDHWSQLPPPPATGNKKTPQNFPFLNVLQPSDEKVTRFNLTKSYVFQKS